MTAKYALCIGINDYPGTENDLSGCVNDANDWAEELRSRGFSVDILINSQATKANILNGMKALLERATAGDIVVFTYSGHGTWVPDQSGDEADGRDEALCPYDLENGPLIDDELAEVFQNRERDVKLVFISDSCHSGTVSRLFNEPGSTPRRVRFLNPSAYNSHSEEKLRSIAGLPMTSMSSKARTGALLLAGCRDSEYSYDASFGGRPNGAFTRASLDVLRSAQPTSYREWYSAIRTRLPSSAYPQTPKIIGTCRQKRWSVL